MFQGKDKLCHVKFSERFREPLTLGLEYGEKFPERAVSKRKEMFLFF
jgi:hypothetical protein